MGLMVHSLENIPTSARRDYFIYLLDYGWQEPISQALRDNFDRMAQLASMSKSVVIKGTEIAHFQINNEEADDLLPALLVTNTHPAYFRDRNENFPGNKNILRVDDEFEDMKLILIPFKRMCVTTGEVVSIIEKVFQDIAEAKDLSAFKIAKEMKKGIGRAIVDAVILEPNFSGVGFDFRKFLKGLR
jgi:hypothetical protein